MELAQTPVLPDQDNDMYASFTVLCVDDEPNILASLQRALRKEPYQLLTATSGADALQIMQETPIDLVISDMRMPEMTGAELLTQVFETSPDTMRILLTGYADMESTVAAINDGHIHQYLSKPWNKEELQTAICNVLDVKFLHLERKRLTELTQQQNAELKALNENLEAKVAERTREIEEASELLQHTYDQLNDSYKQCISVIANLVDIKDSKFSGHGRNVANVAEAIGRTLKLDENALFDLHSAALLHDIGKLGFTDELYNTPYISMSDELRGEYQSHVCIAQAALLSISALDETGRIIRSHGEDFNGKGFPDKLEGEGIPLASRILAIASDFNALQTGALTGDQHSPGQAIAYINSKAGTRYDPNLVRVFETVAASNAIETAVPKEIKLNYQELAAGMVLARDIKTDNGLLMLSEGQLLYDSLIERIHLFIDDTQSSKVVYVTGKSFEASSKTSSSNLLQK